MKPVLLLLLSSALAVAQDDRPTDPFNKFTNPPPAGPKLATDRRVYYTNPSYVLGSSIPFEWTSNISETNLILVKEGPTSNTWVLGSRLTTNYLYWNGTDPSEAELDLKPRDTFWLGVWDANQPGGTPVFFSHYFNFTIDTTTTTTRSSISSSATESSSARVSGASMTVLTTALTTASTTPQITGPNVPTQSQVSVENNSNSTAIGAGAGVGGAILILGLVAFLLYRRRQKKAQRDQRIHDTQYNSIQPAPYVSQALNEPSKELYGGVSTYQQHRDPPKMEGRAQLP